MAGRGGVEDDEAVLGLGDGAGEGAEDGDLLGAGRAQVLFEQGARLGVEAGAGGCEHLARCRRAVSPAGSMRLSGEPGSCRRRGSRRGARRGRWWRGGPGGRGGPARRRSRRRSSSCRRRPCPSSARRRGRSRRARRRASRAAPPARGTPRRSRPGSDRAGVGRRVEHAGEVWRGRAVRMAAAAAPCGQVGRGRRGSCESASRWRWSSASAIGSSDGRA